MAETSKGWQRHDEQKSANTTGGGSDSSSRIGQDDKICRDVVPLSLSQPNQPNQLCFLPCKVIALKGREPVAQHQPPWRRCEIGTLEGQRTVGV